MLKKVQMRGGARRPHARRSRSTLSVRPRAPYLRRWAFFSILLAVEPERGRSVAVVEAGVRRVVLHRRVPGSGEAGSIEIDVVLLLSGVLMDVEDDPAPRL